MHGSFLKKFNKFQKVIIHDEISIIVSYLTLANFVSGVSKIFNGNLVTIGGIRNEKLPYYKYLFEKLIHNYLNDATVFNNYSAKTKFERRGFNPGKICVIQNAIELASTQPDSKSSNGEIRIVTVGRFVKQKDYETALRSFSNLVERNRNREFKYYIVGYGPLEKDVRSMAEQLKIDKKIKILVNPPNITGILKSSDIFLSTSLFEGVSNSIMEALVAGLPVVATDVGDNSYLVKNGHNGYLVRCKDVDTIVDKLEYLSGSDEVRKEFGNNSIKVVETEFSKTRLLDSYLNLFSKLQKNK
jgi:glycosyltransferase involved in cell wall biosynthesis